MDILKIGELDCREFGKLHSLCPMVVRAQMRRGHAQWPRKQRSGVTSHPLYMSWVQMKQRCYCKANVQYNNYGGRGIQVCTRWFLSFRDFLADMGERPEGKTLDRIDNDGNYEPSNCRWATAIEQQGNKRQPRGNIYKDSSSWSCRYRGKYIGRFKTYEEANRTLQIVLEREDEDGTGYSPNHASSTSS